MLKYPWPIFTDRIKKLERGRQRDELTIKRDIVLFTSWLMAT